MSEKLKEKSEEWLEQYLAGEKPLHPGRLQLPSEEELDAAEAAFDAKRDFQIVARTHAGADHPVSLAFPEGEYLKGYVMRAVQ